MFYEDAKKVYLYKEHPRSPKGGWNNTSLTIGRQADLLNGQMTCPEEN